MNLVSIAGALVGTMIDPLIWVLAFGVVYLASNLPWWFRPMAATGAVMVATAAMLSVRPNPGFGNASMAFVVASAMIWSLAFVAWQTWRKPTSSPTSTAHNP